MMLTLDVILISTRPYNISIIYQYENEKQAGTHYLIRVSTRSRPSIAEGGETQHVDLG